MPLKTHKLKTLSAASTPFPFPPHMPASTRAVPFLFVSLVVRLLFHFEVKGSAAQNNFLTISLVLILQMRKIREVN